MIKEAIQVHTKAGYVEATFRENENAYCNSRGRGICARNNYHSSKKSKGKLKLYPSSWFL